MRITVMSIIAVIYVGVAGTSANAEVFNVQNCSFVDTWETISVNSLSTELTIVDGLFDPLSSRPKESVKSFEEYAATFAAYKIYSPFERLKAAKLSWQSNITKNPNEVTGIIKVIDSILNDELGSIRESNCLEWGLFSKGMVEHNIDLKTPLYLEASWSVWQRDNHLKIILEKGTTVEVKSDLSLLEKLAKTGWVQLFDMHNHPALHKHPTYHDLKDLGPNLFPSYGDARYWRNTAENYGNKMSIITDGLYSLEVKSYEFENLNRIYFCSKYPTYYTCSKTTPPP